MKQNENQDQLQKVCDANDVEQTGSANAPGCLARRSCAPDTVDVAVHEVLNKRKQFESFRMNPDASILSSLSVAAAYLFNLHPVAVSWTNFSLSLSLS
jgi:hypothetical protein